LRGHVSVSWILVGRVPFHKVVAPNGHRSPMPFLSQYASQGPLLVGTCRTIERPVEHNHRISCPIFLCITIVHALAPSAMALAELVSVRQKIIG
jgi:hypothetical protein